MHFLENDKKLSETGNFRKIGEQAITREQEDIPKKFFRGSDSFDYLLLHLQYE